MSTISSFRDYTFPQRPRFLLDAEAISNDYYSQVLSVYDDKMALLLENQIWIKPILRAEVIGLSTNENEGEKVTSIAWMDLRTILKGQLNNQETSMGVLDVESDDEVERYSLGRTGGIVSICALNSNVFFAGTRNGALHTVDIRQADALASIRLSEGAVCGLAANGNLVAAGTNCNKVIIRDVRASATLASYEHAAGVKGLAFCDNILASAGGTADRKLKLFDTSTSTHIQEIDLGSQNAGLVWDINGQFLYANNGFSNCDIQVFGCKDDGTLELAHSVPHAHGQDARILFCGNSQPVNDYYVTAATSETVCVWDAVKKTEDIVLRERSESADTTFANRPSR